MIKLPPEIQLMDKEEQEDYIRRMKALEAKKKIFPGTGGLTLKEFIEKEKEKRRIAAGRGTMSKMRVEGKVKAAIAPVVSLPSPQAARGYTSKSLRLVVVGMVGIGAATLYFMRRKKR